jgi:hypothetical protein
MLVKLQKATISFIMSVCPSVHLSIHMEQLGSHWTDIYKIWYLNVFFKSVTKNLNFIKIWKEQWVLYMKNYVHIWYYLPEFFLEWVMSQTKVLEKIKTHIYVQYSFKKFCHLSDNVEKYGRPRQATQDNIIWCMHFACWMTQTRIQTHAHHLILIAFNGSNGYVRAPQCYVIHTLSVSYHVTCTWS